MDFIDHRSTAQFTFLTSATDEKIRINTSGDLLVGISTPFDTSGITLDATGALGVDGHITVATGATYDIGTATNKFRDLYLSGDINVAGVSTSGDLTVGGSLSVTTDATVTGSLTVSTDATITNDLTVSNDATVSGDLTVSTNAVIAGDLTVNGTTTTINTETLDVKDKNITLNYGGDTTSADGAGITIEDAVSAGTDATILWDGSTDTFDFSHAIDVTGTIYGDNNLSIQNSSAYGSIEVGGVSGGFIDIKSPFSDDYDLRLIAEGDGGVINVASGELTIQRAGSAKLATTSTGIAVTGDATFADNGKAIFGADSDLQIYHDGSHSYIKDAGTGQLRLLAGTNVQIWNADATSLAANFNGDTQTSLYYGGNAKLTTASTGIDVTGTLTVNNFASLSSTTLTIGGEGGANGVINSDESIYLNIDSNNNETGKVFRIGTDSTSTGGKSIALFSDNGDISFYEDTGTTAKLFWDASAEALELGTSSSMTPSASFAINEAVNTPAIEIIPTTDDNNADTASIRFWGTRFGTANRYSEIRNVTDGSTANNELAFNTNGTERLRIDSSGFAGLGTNAPAAKLDIVDTSADVQMRVYKNDGVKNTRVTLTADDSGAKIHYRDADNAGALRFNNNLGEVMRITADTTRVGIGTSSPSYALSVINSGNVASFGDGTRAFRVYTDADEVSLLADGSVPMKFYTSGAERLRIDSSGRAGIGTTAPANKLHVNAGTTNEVARFESTDGTAYLSIMDNNTSNSLQGIGSAGDNLTFYSNAAERLRIDSSGRVGVGTSSPPAKLSVFGTGAGNATVQIEGEGGADPYINFLANNAQHWSLGVDDSDADKFKLSEHSALGTNDYLVVDVTGQVGIGTSPTGPLHVAGSGSTVPIKIDNTGTGGNTWRIWSTNDAASDGGGKLGFYNEDTATRAMTLDSSGRVGIGTSNPEKLLHLKTSAINTAFARIESTATNSYPTLSLKNDAREYQLTAHGPLGDVFTIYDGTAGSHRLVIDSVGRVGIGITSPSTFDASNAAGNLVVGSGSGAEGITIYTGTTSNGALCFADGTTSTDTYKGYIQYNHSTDSMQFATGHTERMRLDSSGNLLVGKTNNSLTNDGTVIRQGGEIIVTNTNDIVANFNRTGTDGAIVYYYKDGSAVGSITTTSGSLSVASSGSNISLTASGVGLYADSGVFRGYLSDDATLDLGASNARWKDLHMSGTAALTNGTRNTGGKGGALIVGGNADSNGLTTNTRKIGLITCPSYDNTDGNMALITGDTASASANYIYIGSAYTGYSSPTDIVFRTGSVGTIGSERTRIDASGNQLWGKTSADNTTQGIRFLGSSGFVSIVRSNDNLVVLNRIDGDGTLMEFRTNGTTRGSISISGSTTSYNTTSDERAKQNIEDADDAGAIVDSIQVRKFDWIDGGEHQRYGMVAQELGTVAPEAVSVPDDAEEMQSVDYSKLVPMLVKEIQSLRARVAQLEGEN
jgi:hypothetical protein